jgi:hypothetical protein
MSRWQQIRVRVESIYKKGWGKDFPNLYRVLTGLDNSLMNQDPPLLELVPYLVRLSEDKGLEAGLADALHRHGPKIISLHRQITEAIGGWKLGDAEKLLYELEDNFVELEKEFA